MSLLVSRLDRIQPSPTIGVTQKARELKAAGKDVIGLGAGEPDFDTPEHVKQAAIEAIRNGDTKYTDVDGTPALKQAIIAKFKRRERARLQAGARSRSASAASRSCSTPSCAPSRRATRSSMPAPYWVSYPDIVNLAEGTPVFVAWRRERALQALGQKRSRRRSRHAPEWLVLNSPSNPTGAVYSRQELRALADVLLRHEQVHVMTDDMYEHLIYDGAEFATIARKSSPSSIARTLTVNGVSKAYAMTGWRIGYCGGPAPLIKAMAKLQSQSTSNPFPRSARQHRSRRCRAISISIAERNAEFKKRRATSASTC